MYATDVVCFQYEHHFDSHSDEVVSSGRTNSRAFGSHDLNASVEDSRQCKRSPAFDFSSGFP